MAATARGIGRGQSKVLGSRSKPDLGWLSAVTGRSVSDVEASLSGLDVGSGPVAELVGRIMGSGRAYYAQFPAPLDLYSLVVLTKPKTVVESGVASGVSSAFILMGIRSNRRGVLHSIDLPVARRSGGRNPSWAVPAGGDSGWAVPNALRRGWDLRRGRSEDLLKPLLGEIGGLDFFCHDSPVDEDHFRFEMQAIVPHLGPGSLVVADNTDWDMFERTAGSVGTRALRRRNSSLGAFRVPKA